MSALRLGRNPDGTRAVLILEPAVGRITASRLGIRGGGPPVVVGRLVTGESARAALLRQSREFRERAPRPVCGKWMRQSHEACGRTPGHGTECRSATSVHNAAARARTGHSDPAVPTPIDRLERRRAYQSEWQRERRARERITVRHVG